MQVHAKDLPDTILPGIYHLTGDDEYWLEQSVQKFVSIVGSDSLSLHIFHKEDNFSDAVGSLFSMSFADDSKVVIVKDDLLANDKKHHQMLQDILQSGIEPNYLVLVNALLDAKEKKLVNSINCNKLNEYECISLAQSFFPFGIERNALMTLVRYTDCDLLKIKIESQKLTSYCQDKKVTNKDVENLVVEESQLQIYNFVNSIVIGDNKNALKQLDRLKKRGESHSAMLAMLLNQFRRMLHANISKKTDDELSKIFKVHKYAIIKARENRMFSPLRLKNIVDMIVDYELKFKSGKMSEQVAFDSFVARLIAKEVN
ncbi:MAG: hypothetical protein GX242_04890 [Clostridiales bacterium]|nr:hypothetical protein [Clostridiales bacterium]